MVSKRVLLGFLCVTLTACGGGSGGGSSNSDPQMTGQLVDSLVQGVSYGASVEEAAADNAPVTNNQGEFVYRRGNTLHFYIGSVALGSATGERFITLRDLAASDTAAINMARFLLTLDADGNPDNGIEIVAAVALQATEQGLMANDFALSAAEFTDSGLADFARSANGAARTLLPAAQAETHLLESEADIADGQFDNDKGGDTDSDGVSDVADQCPASSPGANVDAEGCEIEPPVEVADGDADGVADEQDNCVNDANADQLDFDSDGAGDVCDNDDDNDEVADSEDDFPLNSEETTDSDSDGIGDNADNDDDNDGVLDGDDEQPTSFNDIDADGVGDGVDNCPATANSDQGDSDEDGVGDACEPPDADADGIADANDNCPAVANNAQTDTDQDGLGDSCDNSDDRDSDDDGVGNESDLCANTASTATVDDRGCGPDQTNAACGDNLATVAAGRHHQVLLQSNSGERISFEVFEPAEINCGGRGQGAHPLVLHSHGFGGARESDPAAPSFEGSGIAELLAQGFVVISIDQRGFGDSSGSVRVMDPDFEGLDQVQILDWAEQNLDYLAWRNESSGEFMPQPAMASSVAMGANLLVGAIGSSYGGGYQMMTHAIDEKQRLDAMVPDITWHYLPYSLNQGDVLKSVWALLLVGGGEAGSYLPGFENQDSPLARGIDPYIVETLTRSLATNEVPRDAEAWLGYHSPRYWCGLNDQASMPYTLSESELNNNLLGSIENAESNTFNGQLGVDVLFTQGIRDTLFNFNEAWWNYQCMRDRAGEGNTVRLMTHENGHIISGFIGETPDPLYFQAPAGNFACGDIDQRQAQLAFLNSSLRDEPLPDYLADDSLCLSLADGDAVRIPADQFKARRGAFSHLAAVEFYSSAELQLSNVANGVEAQALHLLGQAPQIAPVLTVNDDSGLILAGIPQVDITVSTLAGLNEQVCALGSIPIIRLGCDSILFVGVGIRKGSGEWQLLDDQLAPVRGLGQHLSVDLVGVAERLQPGDEIGLWVSGYHPQYISSFSRDATIPAVNVSAQLRLPLYGVTAEGELDLQVQGQ
ncbi:thrombospondin type 3 repeat-containing protein [Spongiibacter sp. IMCC21906]|uniref:alpha/beta hydrolase n=1 Tax=Spongiibacter sp. IMCC21906 TaxID=1620392 RepID=UPI00062DD492|nr:thrombospondin type 3 repeat-containing protein [Spongiibacter sp. IMCC21906]AKH68949.1 thrombospondin type 3 repeat-containing protein [Spongiibacter sp. IMCC21906]